MRLQQTVIKVQPYKYYTFNKEYVLNAQDVEPTGEKWNVQTRFHTVAQPHTNIGKTHKLVKQPIKLLAIYRIHEVVELSDNDYTNIYPEYCEIYFKHDPYYTLIVKDTIDSLLAKIRKAEWNV